MYKREKEGRRIITLYEKMNSISKRSWYEEGNTNLGPNKMPSELAYETVDSKSEKGLNIYS